MGTIPTAMDYKMAHTYYNINSFSKLDKKIQNIIWNNNWYSWFKLDLNLILIKIVLFINPHSTEYLPFFQTIC